MFAKALGQLAIKPNSSRANSDAVGNGIKSPPQTPRQGGAYPVGASTPIIHIKLNGKTVVLPKYTYHGTTLSPDQAFKGLQSPDKFPLDLDRQEEVNTVLRHHMVEHIPDDEWATGRNLVSTTKDLRVAANFALKDPGSFQRSAKGYVYTIDMEAVIKDDAFPAFDLSTISPHQDEEEVGVLFQLLGKHIVHAQEVYPDPDSLRNGIVNPRTIPNPERGGMGEN